MNFRRSPNGSYKHILRNLENGLVGAKRVHVVILETGQHFTN